MPLTKKGEEILEIFQQEYGKEKGKRNFYATMNRHKKYTRGWHKK